jgi:hypothetical protein
MLDKPVQSLHKLVQLPHALQLLLSQVKSILSFWKIDLQCHKLLPLPIHSHTVHLNPNHYPDCRRVLAPPEQLSHLPNTQPSRRRIKALPEHHSIHPHHSFLSSRQVNIPLDNPSMEPIQALQK